MSFSKTVFTNDVSPDINAVNLNNISNELEFLSNKHGTTNNSSNNYSLTLTNSKYNYDVNVCLTFIANATNTGNSTLNINGLGAKTIKKEIEGNLISIFYGDISIGRLYKVIYDGAYFILLNPSKRDECYQANNTGTDSYSLNLSNEMIYNFGVYSGLTIRMKADVTNSGSSSLSINGSVKTIKKLTRQGIADLTDGNIQSGGLYTLIYDGTYFILQNPTESGGISGTYVGNGADNRFIDLGFTPKMVTLYSNNGSYRSMVTTVYSGIKGIEWNNYSDGSVKTINGNWNGAEITTNGFIISNGNYNSSGVSTYYSAF